MRLPAVATTALLLVLAAEPTSAQKKVSINSTSCPRGDSALRLSAKGKKFEALYDDMRDATRVYLTADETGTSVNAGMTIWFIADFKGKTLAPAKMGIAVEFAVDQAAFAAAQTRESPHASAMPDALLLVDDSARSSLAAVNREMKRRGDLVGGDYVKDHADYFLSPMQALAIANAETVKLRVAERAITYKRNDLTPVREFVRTALCGPGLAADTTTAPPS